MKELFLEAKERSDLYALAARIFEREIDVDLYRRLTSPAIEALFAPRGLQLVEPELSALGESRALQELAVEFCRLFVGPEPICPPYASAWRGEALLGGRTTELYDILRRHGIEVATELGRIAAGDHIAVHLAALSVLHGSEASAGAAHDLARSCVAPWALEWLDELRTRTLRSLYRTAAELGAALLQEELSSITDGCERSCRV